MGDGGVHKAWERPKAIHTAALRSGPVVSYDCVCKGGIAVVEEQTAPLAVDISEGIAGDSVPVEHSIATG